MFLYCTIWTVCLQPLHVLLVLRFFSHDSLPILMQDWKNFFFRLSKKAVKAFLWKKSAKIINSLQTAGIAAEKTCVAYNTNRNRFIYRYKLKKLSTSLKKLSKTFSDKLIRLVKIQSTEAFLSETFVIHRSSFDLKLIEYKFQF